MPKYGAVILAAGEGKRMKSRVPKVLCRVLCKPMLDWVTDSALRVTDSVCVVVGHGGEAVRAHLGGKFAVAEQRERLGTGHAVMQAGEFIAAHSGGHVLILCGDAPLMDSGTLSGALERHEASGSAATVISARLENPFGYGRIVRDSDGALAGIVEEKDAGGKIRAVTEVNSGAYWFAADALLSALGRLTNENAQGEYYLTDVLTLLREDGRTIGAFTAASSDVVLGANDRVQLLELSRRAKESVLRKLMLSGVEIASDDLFVGPDVTVGPDTCLMPGTVLTGSCRIGGGCVIGPSTRLHDCLVGDGCEIPFADLRGVSLPAGTKQPPFTAVTR